MTWHPGYASALEVTKTHRVTIQTVYRLANRAGWRRYVLDGKVRYHRDDVEATLRNRAKA